MLAPPPEQADRRTAAEKRHDEKMAARQGEKTRKMAMKSHRERVNEFNAALESLSEHHDIPRVRQAPRHCVASASCMNLCGLGETELPSKTDAVELGCSKAQLLEGDTANK